MGMAHFRSVPVLSQVIVTFLSSTVVLIANGKFWVVPLLHPVCEMSRSCKGVAESAFHLQKNRLQAWTHRYPPPPAETSVKFHERHLDTF
jgi:hypothetical protein